MRIAQVAPLYEPVPPPLYGGTERVVSYLTEALVHQGHDVTLFASGDSVTAARLVPACPQGLRLAGSTDPLAHHILMLGLVYERMDEFDVVHFHCDYLHFPWSRHRDVPSLTTLHGRLDLPDLAPLYREYSDLPLVSISGSQRTPLPWANWIDTVSHGIPLTLHAPREESGEYLVFLGRISSEKRVDRAVEIAGHAGLPLKIAAKVDPADRAYHAEVRHLLERPGVEFVGEVNDREKSELLGGARALLFPIDWPEPFGLAMIEAMACGTPVIAWRCGSVPELVDPGVTGFVVDSIDDAVAAVERARTLDRRACRLRFEERFTADLMAQRYVECYRRLQDRRHARSAGRSDSSVAA